MPDTPPRLAVRAKSREPGQIGHPRFVRGWFAVLMCLCGFTPPVFAASNPLAISLVSEVTAIEPGKPFYVGLLLKHRDGDHTYWKFPGIVGVPTNVEWNLPEGFKAGPIEWPEPQRVMMFQVKAQGYEGETLLPVRITPPESLQPGPPCGCKGKPPGCAAVARATPDSKTCRWN